MENDKPKKVIVLNSSEPIISNYISVLDFEKLAGIKFEVLGNKLIFGNSLDLRGKQINALPDNIELKGNLDIRETQITSLPKNLHVTGNLDARGLDLPLKKPENFLVEGKYLQGIDFDKYKTEISFPDFLIDNYGFQPDKGSSLRYPKLKNDATGEVLVIKRNANQQYTYFSVHDDSVKGRSILDFVQKELAKDNPNGKQPTLTAVAQTLDGYMASGKVVPPNNSKYHLDAALWNAADNFSDIKSLTEITDNKFLKSRGFSQSTLENPLFKGVFFERSYLVEKDSEVFVYTNTAIKLFNTEGLAGLSQRSTSFKGCLGNRFDSLATSIPVKGKEYDAYFLGESFFDCVSHYEMNERKLRDKTVAYLSSEGAITSGQIALFNRLINEKKPKAITTIFDKDIAGIFYSLKVNSELHIEGKTSNVVVASHDDKPNKTVYLTISDPNGSDNNFQKKLEELFNKDNFKDIVDNPAVEVQLMVNDSNMSTYQVAIPRQYDMLERAIEKVQELRFGPEKIILVEKPITLDFNDDLKASKGMHPDWQIKEINNVRRAVYKGNLLPLEGKEKDKNIELAM